VEFGIGTTHQGESLFKGKEMPELVAVVDGEHISLGKTMLESSQTSLEVDKGIQVSHERLFANFTYQGLLRLVNARKVVMKVGRLEFELKESHLEALRDIASRMVP
jgi:hypothetical protein